MYTLNVLNTNLFQCAVKDASSSHTSLRRVTAILTLAGLQRLTLLRDNYNSAVSPSTATAEKMNTRSPNASGSYIKSAGTAPTTTGNPLILATTGQNTRYSWRWEAPRPWAQIELDDQEEISITLTGTNALNPGTTLFVSEGDSENYLHSTYGRRPRRNGLWSYANYDRRLSQFSTIPCGGVSLENWVAYVPVFRSRKVRFSILLNGGTTYAKAGAAVSDAQGSGTKSRTATKTGVGASDAQGSGAKVRIITKSGYAASDAQGSGADVDIDVDTGGGVSVASATGVRAVTHPRSGIAVSDAQGSGAKARTDVNTGGAIADAQGSGSDAFTDVDTGSGVSHLSATGLKALLYAEAGGAESEIVASGAKAVVYDETGSGISHLSARGQALKNAHPRRTPLSPLSGILTPLGVP